MVLRYDWFSGSHLVLKAHQRGVVGLDGTRYIVLDGPGVIVEARVGNAYRTYDYWITCEETPEERDACALHFVGSALLLEQLDESASSAPRGTPGFLRATAVVNQKIDLLWIDTSTNEEGYRIERSSVKTGPFEEVAAVGANVTSYSDQPLAAETEYCYRVIAFNAFGDSDPSFVACPPLATPTGLSATVLNYRTIDLSWKDNATNERGYRIERSIGRRYAFEVVATVGANVTSFRDQPLAANTRHCYRVIAFNAIGNSGYSPYACSTTPLEPSVH